MSTYQKPDWQSQALKIADAFQLRNVEIEDGGVAFKNYVRGETENRLRFWAAGYKSYALTISSKIAISRDYQPQRIIEPHISVDEYGYLTPNMYQVNWVTPSGHCKDDDIFRGFLVQMFEGMAQLINLRTCHFINAYDQSELPFDYLTLTAHQKLEYILRMDEQKRLLIGHE